jgi:diguanylate cyclase (GGDEF)-like protein
MSAKSQPTRSFHLSIYFAMTVPLAVLAVPLEMALPLFPGHMTFVLMLLPTVMAAIDGGFRPGLATAVAGAVGTAAATWVAQGNLNPGLLGAIEVLLPLAWGAGLITCSVAVGGKIDGHRTRAAELERQCEVHERSIYQLYKDSSCAVEAAEEQRLLRQHEAAQKTDLSMLLLNIQHFGRELSGNLRMEDVLRLIVQVSKKLLKAPQPRVFLLDAATRELVEHTPGAESGRFPANQGMLGWVLRNKQIITAADVAADHALMDLRNQDPAPFHACAPLMLGTRPLGVLAIDAVDDNLQEFDRLLYVVANFSAVAVNNGTMFQQLEDIAHHDGLTGLLNRATFQHRLSDLIKQARGDNHPLAIVMSDVDHFKQINDRYGHQAGDHVLRSVAALWKRTVPVNATAARYGGEEFVCAFPACELTQAAEHAENLRFALEHQELEFEGMPLRVTASFGVAVFPQHGQTEESVIGQADAALYAAKRRGRNRVCVAGETASESAAPPHGPTSGRAAPSTPTSVLVRE